MIYEDCGHGHSFTIEEVITPAQKVVVTNDLIFDVKVQTNYRLIIFDEDEYIVYNTVCTGIAQAREYVSQYIEGFEFAINEE